MAVCCTFRLSQIFTFKLVYCDTAGLFLCMLQLQIEQVSWRSRQGKYWGLWQATRCIMTEEGLPAFWKGHIPAQLLSVCYGAVQVLGDR